MQSFLREGRVVGPCWEKLKPKGPKGLRALALDRDSAFKRIPNQRLRVVALQTRSQKNAAQTGNLGRIFWLQGVLNICDMKCPRVLR